MFRPAVPGPRAETRTCLLPRGEATPLESSSAGWEGTFGMHGTGARPRLPVRAAVRGPDDGGASVVPGRCGVQCPAGVAALRSQRRLIITTALRPSTVASAISTNALPKISGPLIRYLIADLMTLPVNQCSEP